MEMKFEKTMWVSSDLSPKQQAEVRKKLETFTRGAEQQIIGTERKKIIDEFIGMIEPARRAVLEDEIARLHQVEDKDRFRTQLLMMMIDAFGGGYCFAKGINREEWQKREAASDGTIASRLT